MVVERGENPKNSDQTPNDDDNEEGRYQKEGKRPHPIREHSQQYRVRHAGLHFMQSPERQGTLRRRSSSHLPLV